MYFFERGCSHLPVQTDPLSSFLYSNLWPPHCSTNFTSRHRQWSPCPPFSTTGREWVIYRSQWKSPFFSWRQVTSWRPISMEHQQFPAVCSCSYQVTMLIVFAILILATAVPDIQVVMSFGGSLGGTFIAFMPLGSFNLQLFHPLKFGLWSPNDLASI